jgi:KDO2-lipid IV(A) lauroyltransferase
MSPADRPSDFRPSLQHRLEYLMLLLCGAVAGIMPRFLMLMISRLLGTLVFDLVRIRRRVTLTNLQRAFPDFTPGQRRRTGRAAYVNLAVVGMEMLRARRLDPRGVIALVELDPESEALLHELMAAGRGAVIVGAHYGTWELLGARLAAVGYEAVAIMQEQRNQLMNEALIAVRERLGIRLVEKAGAGKEIMRTLAAGGLILIVGDQDAGREHGIFLDFFDSPAATHGSPAAFALRAGAPLLGGWIHREGLRYSATLTRLDEPDEHDRNTDEQAGTARLTAAYLGWLEEGIRADPGQYLWLHRRWKTRPECNGGGA